MRPGLFDPRIDAYIAKAQPAAQPILNEIRAAVHAACPDVEETLKWRTPTFDYKGIMLGMASFRKYTTMSFWKPKLMRDRLSAADRKALDRAGEVKIGDALPGRAVLVRLVKVAAQLNDEGVAQPRVARKKPALKTPAYFTAALKKNAAARARFAAFPPSHRREYLEWVTEAKQEETRQRRVAQAVEWIAQGKGRNWKYE